MTREGLQKDDPQFHLLAAQHCEKTRKILKCEPEEFGEEELGILNSSIKFFAHFIKYLPECSNDILNVCRAYTANVIEIDLVAINRAIVICTTMLIRRREENVVRSTCLVLKGILEMIPTEALKAIVNRHSKTIGFIFQKIYLVQTYYSQLRILDIFVFITKDLIQLRDETISKHRLMVNANAAILNKIFDCLNNIETKNFINTSKRFLRIFNNYLFPKTCILSIEGYIVKINDQSIKQNVLTTFNGRNVTVSCFVPNKTLISGKLRLNSKCQRQSGSELIFIEFDCQSIDIEENANNDRQCISINIIVKQADTDDTSKCPVVLDDIKRISFKLMDEQGLLEKFKDTFYQKFKLNEPMIQDNTSIVDRESVMTFETSASMREDLISYSKEQSNMNIVGTQNIAKNIKINAIVHEEPTKDSNEESEIENKNVEQNMLKKVNPQQSSKAKVANRKPTNKQPVAASETSSKIRPKRRNVKKVDNKKQEDIYDDDNMSKEEKITVSYREFKTTQKMKKSSKKNEKDSENDNPKYYLLTPVKTDTQITQKRVTLKLPEMSRKTTHYGTDESDEERQENGKNRKTVIAKKINHEVAPKNNENLLKNINKKEEKKAQDALLKIQAKQNTISELENSRKSLAVKSSNIKCNENVLKNINKKEEKKAQEALLKIQGKQNAISELENSRKSLAVKSSNIKNNENVLKNINKKEEKKAKDALLKIQAKQNTISELENSRKSLAVKSSIIKNETVANKERNLRALNQQNIKLSKNITPNPSLSDDLDDSVIDKKSANKNIPDLRQNNIKRKLLSDPSDPLFAAKVAKIEKEKNKQPLNGNQKKVNQKTNGRRLKKDNAEEIYTYHNESMVEHEIELDEPKLTKKFKPPMKQQKMTKDNVFEMCMMDDNNEENSLIEKNYNFNLEEWLQDTSNSIDFSFSDQIESPMSFNSCKNYQNNEKSHDNVEVSGNDVDDADESEISFNEMQNDEHQHYSSSNQEISDSDVQNEKKSGVVATVIDQIASQHNNQLNYRSPFSFVNDPCKIFENRSREVLQKLNARKRKADDYEKEVLSKYDRTISINGQKLYEQIQKTKSQATHVIQLLNRFKFAKSKLSDELKEQEKLSKRLMCEVLKRREAFLVHKQFKNKELMNLKKEAIRKNEELMNDIWREYIDGFQTNFNSSLNKAYDI